MRLCVLTIATCLLFPTVNLGQTGIAIEGVWRVAEIVVPRLNPQAGGASVTVRDPQPGLWIFTKGYYTQMSVQAGAPRPALPPPQNPQNLTDAEKIARYAEWRAFSASSGTYEVKGSMLISRVIVAKNVDVMTRETQPVWEIRAEGHDTLWLIPSGREVTEPQLKLTRLE